MDSYIQDNDANIQGYLGADFSHMILDEGLPFLILSPSDPVEGNLGVSVAAYMYVQVRELILQAEVH